MRRKARLVFDTVDLHYLREQRAAELEQREDLARVAAKTRAQEIGIMRECDVSLVVSPVEQEILARDAPGVAVDVLSNVHEIYGCRRPFEERRDLVFVGGFQHPPNSDAVIWFVREILPRVLDSIPELRLHVIGSKVTEEIQALAGEHVLVHGFVEDIAPFMDTARISIAPLRYGAGVKGKVNMAMSYGLPVVATPIAVEGMHVRAGLDVSVAEDARRFAEAIVKLYGDKGLWERLSVNGLATSATTFRSRRPKRRFAGSSASEPAGSAEPPFALDVQAFPIDFVGLDAFAGKAAFAEKQAAVFVPHDQRAGPRSVVFAANEDRRENALEMGADAGIRQLGCLPAGPHPRAGPAEPRHRGLRT